MIYKRILWTVISVCLVISGCSERKSQSEALTISVIPKGTTHVFWKSIQAGAYKAGKELNITINWIGPEKEDDRQQQIALVDNQVMNQVSGIVLSPIDDSALRRPVHSAVEKGIPVIIIDSGLKDSEDIYTSFIATDNYLGGQMAGRELSRLLGGQGKVIVLRFVEGSASTEERARGFIEVIRNETKIEIVSDEQYGGATQSQAQQVSDNLLLRYTKASGELGIDGIFCTNESTTYGMLQALKRKRLEGKINFIGFDSSPVLIEGVKNQEIQGLVVQNPFRMGYLGVKTLAESIHGKKVAKKIDTGVILVSSDNLSEPEVQDWLYPDLKKWLGE